MCVTYIAHLFFCRGFSEGLPQQPVQQVLICGGMHPSMTHNVNPELINPKRLFNWGDTIYVSDYDYWGNTPLINKPWIYGLLTTINHY